jgi:histidine triad (HIT) family protein
MQDCIFCKIVKGEIPCYKVYEDANFLGFLDINPRNLGHTLLIPKKHFRWVDDVQPYDLFWQTAKKLSVTIQKTTNCTTVSKVVIGLDVPHAHIHLIPRFSDSTASDFGLDIKKISPEQMNNIAQKISDSFSRPSLG